MDCGRGSTSLPAQMARKRQRGGCSAEEEDDMAEVELGGEPTVVQDPILQMVDLDMRAHRVEMEKEWCVKAKVRAERMRFGMENDIKWWRADKKQYPLENVRLKADTGVHEFQVDALVCERLLSLLTDPSNYDKDGFLMMAGTQFPGYGNYPYVHAPLGHVAAAQEKRTTRVHGKTQVNAVLQHVPEVLAVVEEVRCALGLPGKGAVQGAGKAIYALHFLTQDASQQAVFSWHNDGEDLHDVCRANADNMTTVIVNLSCECSAMRIWGCAPVLYRTPGHAVAFPGSALHESVPRHTACAARGAVYKVAFFFN